MKSMHIFQGIVDVFDENELDLRKAFDQGIRVILHQTSQGLYKVDSAYKARKKAAIEMGFLWAGYHFLSAEDTAAQLDRFLSIEDGSDPSIGLAIDWEASKKGTMAFEELRTFVKLFNDRMKPRYADRFPLVYGGSLIREAEGIQKGDPLLAKCPLWYARFTNGPLEIPAKTWSTYTLFQFDDENRQFGAPPKTVVPGADFNRYQGTFDELRAAWPFAGVTAGRASLTFHDRVAGDSFSANAVAVAGGQWDFFGEQTFDQRGRVTQSGHKEGEEGFFQQVGVFWRDGVNINGVDGRNHDQPWSAAFISWVMKTAGAGDRFRYSAQHSVYISQAIRDFLNRREAAGYWGVRLFEAKPIPGDIVCWARQAGIDYDHQNGGDYMGHCDLVVEVGDEVATVIGGNVADSVTKRPFVLTDDGFLAPTEQGGEVVFALMRNRIATPLNPPLMA